MPSTIPRAGSAGTDGTLVTTSRPEASATIARSVNVPPTSIPSRHAIPQY